MSNFVYHTFGGASEGDLINYSGETGGPWTRHSAAALSVYVLATSGYAYGISTSTPWKWRYTAAGTPASADYDVEVEFYRAATAYSPVLYVGATLRADSTNQNGYFVGYDMTNTRWIIAVLASNAISTVICSYTQALSDHTAYTVKATVRGSNFELFVDGVSRATGTDSTTSSAGLVGLWGETSAASNASGRLRYYTFTATNAAGGGGGAQGAARHYYTMMQGS